MSQILQTSDAYKSFGRMGSTRSTLPSSSSTPDLQQSQEEDELEREDSSSYEMRSRVVGADEDESVVRHVKEVSVRSKKDNNREDTSFQILEDDDHLTGSTDSLNYDNIYSSNNTTDREQQRQQSVDTRGSQSGQSKRNGQTRHSRGKSVNQVNPLDKSHEDNVDQDDWSRSASFESSDTHDGEQDNFLGESKSNGMKAFWNNKKKNVFNSKQGKWKKTNMKKLSSPQKQGNRKHQQWKNQEETDDETTGLEVEQRPFSAPLSSSAFTLRTTWISSCSCFLIFLTLSSAVSSSCIYILSLPLSY
jgi:hypothetical protein